MQLSPSRPVTTARAWICVLINQLATPGLGSFIAGKRIAGSGQLALSIGGFGLITLWMIRFFYHMMQVEMGQEASPAPGWLMDWGGILFGAAWVWSLVTSVMILIQAYAAERAAPPRIQSR
jgi:hypothetical protein